MVMYYEMISASITKQIDRLLDLGRYINQDVAPIARGRFDDYGRGGYQKEMLDLLDYGYKWDEAKQIVFNRATNDANDIQYRINQLESEFKAIAQEAKKYNIIL